MFLFSSNFKAFVEVNHELETKIGCSMNLI